MHYSNNKSNSYAYKLKKVPLEIDSEIGSMFIEKIQRVELLRVILTCFFFKQSLLFMTEK